MRYDKMEINHEKIAQLASRARHIKYFLQMHVHAASSERSCENAHLYRIDLAFAACMYVSSIDLNWLVLKYSFSFLHLLIVIADNTQNGLCLRSVRVLIRL